MCAAWQYLHVCSSSIVVMQCVAWCSSSSLSNVTRVRVGPRGGVLGVSVVRTHDVSVGALDAPAGAVATGSTVGVGVGCVCPGAQSARDTAWLCPTSSSEESSSTLVSAVIGPLGLRALRVELAVWCGICGLCILWYRCCTGGCVWSLFSLVVWLLAVVSIVAGGGEVQHSDHALLAVVGAWGDGSSGGGTALWACRLANGESSP